MNTQRQIELTLHAALRSARRSLRRAETLEVIGTPHQEAWEPVHTCFALVHSYMEDAGKYFERTRPPQPRIATTSTHHQDTPTLDPQTHDSRVKHILGHEDSSPPPPPAIDLENLHAPPPPEDLPAQEPIAPQPPPPVPATEPVQPAPRDPDPAPRSFVGMSRAQFEKECRHEARQEPDPHHPSSRALY